jgi:hypothetical protein
MRALWKVEWEVTLPNGVIGHYVKIAADIEFKEGVIRLIGTKDWTEVIDTEIMSELHITAYFG